MPTEATADGESGPPSTVSWPGYDEVSSGPGHVVLTAGATWVAVAGTAAVGEANGAGADPPNPRTSAATIPKRRTAVAGPLAVGSLGADTRTPSDRPEASESRHRGSGPKTFPWREAGR